MKARFLYLTIVFLVIGMLKLSWAQADANNTCKVAEANAWSYSNGLVIMDNFELLYDSHFSALLAAEKQFKHGAAPMEIVAGLKSLPGIKGVVFSSSDGSSLQAPEGIVPLKVFTESIFQRGEATSRARAPMMQRKGGGQIRFVPLLLADESFDLMVRYVRADTVQPPHAAICLVLDRNWLLPQISLRMDSLAHESRQLLFWAASSTNRFMEQSLGIIHNGDTLWWTGRKDVAVTNIQPLWPFGSDIEIHSHVHPLKRK